MRLLEHVCNKQYSVLIFIYSWSDVCELIKEKVNNFFTTSLAFQYLDEDADYISVSSPIYKCASLIFI
jgi:hypothetical protein